ncbi:ferrochelatase, protoheme ferro-lyase [hydrocarbon metagenome]|uniref:Ferrochelatase, protoheme ferro-lyase n=1 Tax=hydrocarbon metagenome TaxID=938273 RepID=A0A0W8G014_9ZZZZ
MNKTAVVLFQLGGPDSISAIEPFLYNLFQDPDIFKIPIGQKFFAKIISKRRAPKVAEEYELIGGKSPINEWTEIQRRLLEEELRKEIDNVDVITAMRYWHPLTNVAAKKIEDGNYDNVVLLPLYPHNSISTVGSSFNEWNRVYKGDTSKLIYIYDFYNNEKYIKALNERIDETLERFPEEIRNDVQLVFSAHGTPISMVKNGDPYSKHIQETVNLVMKMRNNSHEYHLCYQSKVGPVKWLEPATDKMIEELAHNGKKHLLIVPISFVSDHVETLFELDIEYREDAEKNNIENYIVMKGLNDSPTFISALKEITINAINN